MKLLKIYLGSIVLFCAGTVTYAAPGDPTTVSPLCSVTINTGQASEDFYVPITQAGISSSTNTLSLESPGTQIATSAFLINDPLNLAFIDILSTPPTTAYAIPGTLSGTEIPPVSGSSVTSYIAVGANLENEVCFYSYTLSFDGTEYTRDNLTPFTPNPPLPPISAPTAVPIFTPLGLVATISGLLWFGRRRSIKVKSS